MAQDARPPSPSRRTDPLLSIRDLHTYFHTDGDPIRAVDGVSFDLYPGETVAVVGESGSGKTVLAETITGLVERPPGYVPDGEIRFDGRDTTAMSEPELRGIRGGRIGHVFQNPSGALTPTYTIGWQMREAIERHGTVTGRSTRRQAIEYLRRTEVPSPTDRLDDYPHELSGGMKQRVLLAMALACEPELLIADEPTTALDVTIQAELLDLLDRIQRERDLAILFITHDLSVVAEVADRVVVMYAGNVMEVGPVEAVLSTPAHPYTRALLECLPGSGGFGGIPGDLPDPADPPDGCRFADRCPLAVDACHSGDQPDTVRTDSEEHRVSCVHYDPGDSPERVLHATGDRRGERRVQQ